MSQFRLQSMRRTGRERGAVLIITLVLLVGLTLLVVSGVTTSTMELRMAGAVESQTNNFQTAMAAIDFVISDDVNLPKVGPLSVPVTVTLPDDTGINHEVFDVVGTDTITATAARVQDCAPPPRMKNANSLTAFSAFRYEISASIEKNDSGMGRQGMNQGYILLGPKC